MTRLCLFALAALLPAVEPDALQQMQFKNNVLPGHLTEHRIRREVTRTVKRAKHTEKLRYRQDARWVQCNAEDPRPASVIVYQMIVESPAIVLSVHHGKKATKELPSAAQLNLPKPTTRLVSESRTSTDSVVSAGLGDAAQRVILQTLLDSCHWPNKKLDAGHRWERTFKTAGFEGTQTFEFVDLVAFNKVTAARVTIFAKGNFTGALAKQYKFEKVQAILHWSRGDRTLLKLEGKAFYERLRESAPEKHEMKIDVDLIRIESLDEAAQDLVLKQLGVFAAALKKQEEADPKLAIALCKQFRSQWPDSRWMPAVDDLEDQLAAVGRTPPTYSEEQISDILIKTIITFEAARASREYDILENARTVLTQLASDYRSKLVSIAKDGDEGARSRAIFALAFSRRPPDIERVQSAVRDKSPKVRAMALAGLASAAGKVGADALLTSIGDSDATVRRRACEAVASCISPEDLAVARLIEKLDRLMVHDKNAGVRLSAVRAIAAIGAPADISLLEKALFHELNQDIRREIEAGIKKLRSGQ
jgi:HEAT repeat protein